MNLTERQQKILELLKIEGNLSGDEIAKKLNLTRSALRTDFSILKNLKYIYSKKKSGYFYNEQIKIKLVKDVMSEAKMVDANMSIYDSIIYMFSNDVGSIFVVEKGENLVGVISRKDLLKSSLGNKNLENIPVNMIMTRMPNVLYVEENDKIEVAVKKIVEHQIDSVAVIQKRDNKKCLVGRFSKTNIAKLYLGTL